jgi:hypothetical protein
MTANAPAGKRVSRRKRRSRGKSRLYFSIVSRGFLCITLHIEPFKPLAKTAL